MAESRYTEAQINAGNYAMSLSSYERRRQLTEEQQETVRQMLEEGLLTASRDSSDIGFQADRPRQVIYEEPEKELGRQVDVPDSIMGSYRVPTKESIDRSMKRLDEPFWGVKEDKDKLPPGALRRDVGRTFATFTGSPIIREFITEPLARRALDYGTKPSLGERIGSFLKGEKAETEEEKSRREAINRVAAQGLAENVLPFNVDGSFGIVRDSENEIKFSLFGLTDEHLEEMRSETGESIQPSMGDMETGVGMVGYMGGFIVGFGKIKGAISGLKLLKFKNPNRAVKFTNELVRSTLAGAATEQLVFDPDENIFNVLEDNFTSLENSEIIKFLSVDQEDERLERRLKLLGEGFIIGAGFDVGLAGIAGIGRGAKAVVPKGKAMFSTAFQKLSHAMYSVPLEKLTSTQKGEVFVEWLRQVKDKLPIDAIPQVLSRPFKATLTNTEAERQANSFIYRWRKHLFNSRGYADEEGFNIFRDEEYAKRQSTAKAESLSRQLDFMLTKIVGETKSKTMMASVQKALKARGGGKGMRWKFLKKGEAPKWATTTSRGNPKKYSVVEKIDEDGWIDQGTKTVKKTWDELTDTQKVAIYYNIPENIAAPLYQSRKLIDELTFQLRKYIPKEGENSELYETMTENLGRYLNRSYEAFENNAFKSDSNLKEKVLDHFMEAESKAQLKAQAKAAIDGTPPPKMLTTEELENKARLKLAEEYGDMAQIDDYAKNARAAGSGILKRRGKPPKILREYLGEIKDPGANVLLTITKMANLLSKARAHDRLYEAGKGKYIFKAEQVSEGLEKLNFNVKIDSINPKLDGMYTDKYTAMAIRNEESTFSFAHGDGGLSKVYQNYLKFKGFGQASKTILSHVTHLRNVAGGAFFLAANGSNPFLGDGITKAANALLAKTNDELSVTLDEYTRLGIINTKVDINQFRELIATESRNFKRPSLATLEEGDTFSSKLSQTFKDSELKKMYDGIETTYMATDDFFKIASYESELAVLKRARNVTTKSGLKAAKEEAAEIVRNTIPNYDLIPKGIKSLRELPFGNFVAFPAEIIRTSAHIIKQASKEITSGNKEIVERGLKRLAGFTTVMAGPGNLEQLSIEQMGWTPEQAEWANTLVSPEWSQDSPKIWMVSEDGKLFYNDTQFANPYSYLQEAVRAGYRELQTGRLKGEELDRYITGAIFEGASTFMKPYVSQSILTKSMGEVFFATVNPNGRTLEGKQIFPPDDPLPERLSRGVFELIKTFEPGTVTSLKKLLDAKVGTLNEFTGRQTDLNAELLVNLTGIKYTAVNFEDSLNFAIGDYVQAERRISREAINYASTDESVLKHYEQRQLSLYNLQQDLYRRIEASNNLMGRRRTRRILEDNPNISKVRARALSDGLFRPEELTDERYEAMRDIPGIKNRRRVRRQIRSLARNMNRTELVIPLDSTEDYSASNLVHRGELHYTPAWLKEIFEDIYEAARETFAKGGEVDIPQAPTEPDERIDKMTGLPYDQQAGGAFVDQEDRKRFSIGSEVLKRAVKLAGKTSRFTKQVSLTRDRDLELLSRDFTRLSDGLEINKKEMNEAMNRIRDRLRENDGVLGEPPQKMDRELEEIGDTLSLEKQADDVDELTNIILKSSRKNATIKQAQEAANKINNMIEGGWGAEDAITKSKAYALARTNTKVLLEEKHSPIPSHLLDEKGGIDTSNPRKWSEDRGYTPDEINTFEEASRLANELGLDDGAQINWEINNILDSYKLRDVDYKLVKATGGKVLGSLKRTRRAKGGYI